MPESLRSHLLIASPRLADHFQRTVVLVLEHNEEGAMGVVLNRPSEAPVRDAVPGLADLGEPDHPDAPVRRARVYAGYAGWAPEQLEAELEEEAWIVEPVDPDDPFHEDDLWPAALRRKGGEYALLARMPVDPSLN